MLFNLVAFSVIMSFICTEFTGLLTGGLVSAGYLAYFFHEPTRIASTLVIAIILALIVRLLQHFIILYGRRRFALTLVLSLIAVWILDKTAFLYSSYGVDFRMIGYIVPGLIASDMEKQGILKTLLTIFCITAVIRLLVIIGG